MTSQKNQGHLLFHRQESQKHPKINNYNLCAKDLAQTCVGSVLAASVSVSPYEPCLVDCVGVVLLVLLTL